MASDLLRIGQSGASAARAALDVSAQNIANAATEGYVRRGVRLSEVGAAGGWNRIGDLSLSGVWVDGVTRNADLFRAAELRRTGSDIARADAELGGLKAIEAGLEQSSLYPAITGFEAALQALKADSVDSSLRAAALEAARSLVAGFGIAAHALDTAGEGLRFEASDSVAQVNLLSGELARINLRLSRAAAGTSDQCVLLDARDNLLQRIAEHVDITASFAANQSVEVRLGSAVLVAGGSATSLALISATDGTISFTLGGGAASMASGSLAGRAQALTALSDFHGRLDSIAAALASAANAAQASGAALNGSAGQPLFAGSTASDIALALADGAGIATAPAGSGANSRDPANLTVLLGAIDTAGVVQNADSLLFAASSLVAGRSTTREAFDAIAQSARIAFSSQAGVDLDQEAANLMRYQQAFQASGRVMQVAADLFDTLLQIR